MLIKFDMPSSEVNNVAVELKKDLDYIRSGVAPLVEYDEEFQIRCSCAERGVFAKNAFNFEKPLTSWHKKKNFKNYGLRL
jgi:hypothetical protein